MCVVADLLPLTASSPVGHQKIMNAALCVRRCRRRIVVVCPGETTAGPGEPAAPEDDGRFVALSLNVLCEFVQS